MSCINKDLNKYRIMYEPIVMMKMSDKIDLSEEKKYV